MEALLRELRARPEVEYAEPNYILSATLTPNDPFWATQGSWGQAFDDLWGLHKIDTAGAWDRTQGEGVLIGVLDTGVDYNHEDLAPNAWSNLGETGFDALGQDKRANGVDDDGNGYIDDWHGWNFVAGDVGNNDPLDDHYHGTHVAGTIAAVGNNGIGIVGVAPRSRILPLKVLDSTGSGTVEAISRAIVYGADLGVRVFNASLGGFGPTPQVLVDAIGYAHDVKQAVFVAAAGNDGTSVGRPDYGYSPANIRDVITVSAFDHTDAKAWFSNYGTKVDVGAPGGGDSDPTGTIAIPYYSVLSLRSSDAPQDLSQLFVGSNYLRLAGTSMACPHVAGVAALVMSKHPEYSAEQVRQAIRVGSDDLLSPGFDQYAGYGRLNAGGALDSPSPLAVQLTEPARSLTSAETATIRGTTMGPGFAGWVVEYGSGLTPQSWTTINQSSQPAADTFLASWNLAAVPDGTYTLRLRAHNTFGFEHEDRLEVLVDSIFLTEPSPLQVTPVIRGPMSVSGTVAPAKFQRYWLSIHDSNGNVLPNARITLPNAGFSKVVGGVLGTWDPTGLPADHYWIYVWVETDQGLTYERVKVIVDPMLHAGWPRRLQSPTEDHLVAADINGDGASELIACSGNSVEVLTHSGNTLPGWPKSVDPDGLGQRCRKGPASADVTGDASPEIIASNDAGEVFVWNADGTLLYRWQHHFLDFQGSSEALITIADVNGDGHNDLVVVGPMQLAVFDPNGTRWAGWSRGGCSGKGPASVADLDGDGPNEIVVADSCSIYVYRSDGSLKPGWPRDAPVGGSVNYSYQAVGDLDADGKLEIVRGWGDGTVVAYRADGNIVSGWPQAIGAKVNSCAVGDLDGDGRDDVVCGRSNSAFNEANQLFAWHGDGTPIAGWPVQVVGPNPFFGVGVPALVDADGDGHVDVVVSTDINSSKAQALHVFDANGNELPDFPRPTRFWGDWSTNTVAVADLDGDGKLEMAWLELGFNGPATLYVWDLPARSDAPAPWPMFHADARHTGRVQPTTQASAFGLSVIREGSGTGAIVSSPQGIDCGPSCAAVYGAGTEVSLDATPVAGSVFRRWGGACSGTQLTCSVTMDAPKTATAIFALVDEDKPTISGFAPSIGWVGTRVWIAGASFVGVTAVRFNGVAALTYTVDSPMSITATVPAGATNGPISVTTARGTGISASSFTVLPAYPVLWTNLVGVSVAGNNLTKTSGADWWDSGAVSTQTLPFGDGFVQFVVTETTTDVVCGLGNGNTNQSYEDVEYGLLATWGAEAGLGAVWVYESGVPTGALALVSAGDHVRVGVESGVVTYRKNGVVFHASSVPPNYPLVVDTSLRKLGGTISNAVVAGFVEQASTATAIASSLNPSSLGQSVSFTATVSPASATGSVTFKDGTTVLGSAPISGGTAVLATFSLLVGTRSISATYGGDGGSTASVSPVLNQVVNADGGRSPGDATGDSLGDLLARQGAGAVQLLQSTGTSFTPSQWTNGFVAHRYDVYFADVTGDGKRDVISRRKDTGDVEVFRSTGASFAYTPGAGPGGVWSYGWGTSYDLYFADVNEDGKADLIGRLRSNGDVYVFPSTGSGFSSAESAGAGLWSYGWSSGYDLFVADVTGDGKADLVARYFGPSTSVNTGDIVVGISTGTRFAFSGRWTYGFSAGYTLDFTDVTGDGKADLVARYAGVASPPLETGDVFVLISTGSAFSWNGNFERWSYGWGSTYEMFLRDVTGDGRADLVGRHTGNGDVYVARAGTNVFTFLGPWATGYLPDWDLR